MNEAGRQSLYLAPRILCIIFAAFLAIFALDVFTENNGFWQTVVALLMHLVPSFLILVVLAISWRWEWVGAVVFAALGVLYVVMAWGRFPMSVYFIISGPLFVIAGLFLVNWVSREKPPPQVPFKSVADRKPHPV